MNNRACKMLLFAICATLLHAGPAGRENDQQKLAEAAGLARQHRFLEADRAIQGVSVPPDLTQAIAFHRLRAAIDAGLKRPKESAEEMQAALRLAPADPGLIRATAVAEMVWLDAQLKARSHPDLAASVADLRGLEARGLQITGEMEALLGEAYESMGDSVSSARSFQEAMRLSPNEERFRIALAIELMRHQTYEPALAILKQSMIDFPQSARTRTALALTLFLSGKEREGTAQLLEAISLDPRFVPAIRYLGHIAVNQGPAPEQPVVKAECDYANAHPADDESNTYCGALEARLATSNPDTADWRPILHRLGLAAVRSPNSGIARCEYGKALYETHEWTRARRELRACVQLDPNSVEGHYRLARVYERLGQKDLARNELLLRAVASNRLAAANEAREQAVKGFLYTMGER